MKTKVKALPILSKIGLILVIASVYFFVGQDGFWLAIENENVVTLVSASGVALASVLLLGNFVWPGILLGSFIYNVVFLYPDITLSNSTIYLSSFLISIGSTLQALVGGYLIRKFCETENPFIKVQCVFRFAFIVLFICVITATITSITYRVINFHARTDQVHLWFSLWISEVAGIFLLVPLLFGWAKNYARDVTKKYISLSLILYSAIFISGGLIFLGWFPESFQFRKAYFTLPLLLWAAFSFEEREVVTAIALSSVFAYLGTVRDLGPFSAESVNEAFISSQVYGIIISVTILTLRAAINERKKSSEELKIAHEELKEIAEKRKLKLNTTLKEVEEYQKRIDSIFNILLKYTIMDFAEKAPVSKKADEIDAIAAGLNTLGEELQHFISAEKKYISELEVFNGLLQDSEQQIQTIIDNAPEAVMVMDTDGVVERWNPTAEEIFGWNAHEITGKQFQEFVIPLNHREAYYKGIKDFLVGRKKHVLNKPLEIEVINRQGELFFISLNISPTFIKGRYLFIVFARDITEIKKAHEELRQSQAFLNSVVENIPNMLFIKDAKELKFVRLNKAGEDLIGYSRADLMGKNDYDFFPKAQADYFTNKDKEVIRSKKLFEITEEKIQTKNKGVRILETKKIPLFDEKGNSQYLLGISNDITDRIKMEEELKQKSEELIRSNTELEQFAYVASHDLQEPLRMVTSYVQLLSKRYKDKLDQDANDFIGYAVDGSNRMKKLINSLLEYSRINRVKPFETVNLNVLLKDVLHDLQHRISENNAKIIINKMPEVFGDHVLLGQLFLNLIGNALKFRGERTPEITISCEKNFDEFNFSVKDNGIGIQKEYSEKIFIIFQQLHSKHKYEGTGIGLAICKKIVERHGGKIWIESKVDEGTTFHFTIKDNFEVLE